MARPRNGDPVLKLRKARHDAAGRLTHKSQWFIYDRGKQIVHHPAWGIDLRALGEGDAEAAEGVRKAYTARKYAEELARPKRRSKKAPPASETLIEDVLSYYMQDTAPRFEVDEARSPGAVRKLLRQKADFAGRMEVLLNHWEGMVVDDIDKDSCKEFAAKQAASRSKRCLEDLRAAVNLAVADRRLAKDGEHVFWMPRNNPPRYGFFTRGQVARLLWAAYRKRGTYTHSPKRSSSNKAGTTTATDLRPMRHIARFLLVAIRTGTRTDRIEQASFYPEPGRPFVDVEAGLFYRSWSGEDVAANKRADTIQLPPLIWGHLRRWKANGARYVVEYRGRPVGCASAFFRLLREVIPPEERKAHRLNRHACKHTCATWLMHAGVQLSVIAGYLSTDERTIVRHYGHHHPDHQSSIGEAFAAGKAGRIRGRRDKADKPPQAPTAATNPMLAVEVRRSIRDLFEIVQAPVAAFGVLDLTPDAGLETLRETVKRSARSGDWSALLGENAA